MKITVSVEINNRKMAVGTFTDCASAALYVEALLKAKENLRECVKITVETEVE